MEYSFVRNQAASIMATVDECVFITERELEYNRALARKETGIVIYNVVKPANAAAKIFAGGKSERLDVVCLSN